MNGSTIARFCRLTALWTFGWMAFNCSAEVFYAGQTTGFPNDEVELSINARAGTVLEAIDILPDYDAVAGKLNFVSLAGTPALADGGIGECPSSVQTCGFFYTQGKTFSTDSVLATLRFRIDPGASAGPVPFDPGVIVGEEILPAATFQVLAVPEPSSWAMLLLGLLVVACAILRKTDARSMI